MNKYIIEGGINFFDELYKSLDDNSLNNTCDSSANNMSNCLISNEPLIDKWVELNCGHKFNYIPLYNDLVNHKHKFNVLEGSKSKLLLSQIRCPYCRNKQDTLLPYYDDLGLPKINGVNCLYSLKKQTNYNNDYICEYNIPNVCYDCSKEESPTNKKNIMCGAIYAAQVFIYNKQDQTQLINCGDYKTYCYTHRIKIIKEYKLKEKQKKMLANKQLKELKNKEIQKAKILEKEKIKQEKIKLKLEKTLKQKTTNIENIVLGPSIIENKTDGCKQLLKSGPNRGMNCGCKLFDENLCKRHYSLVNNNK